MSVHELWEKALSKTEIVRPRIKALSAVRETDIPYIFLGESVLNRGDTVVRKGEVKVGCPNLMLPSNAAQFEGFEFEEELQNSANYLMNFFLIRGIEFPSMKYQNSVNHLNVFEGGLHEAVKKFRSELEKQENISTGLVFGPEDCWQFSVLILVCSQVIKSADTDIEKILERYKRRGR